MKKHLGVVPLVILLCLTSSCQRESQKVAKDPAANVEADVAAIKALLDEWIQLYNAGDFDRLMSIFYAENSILMSPNVSILKGKEAIRLWYQEAGESNIEHVNRSVAEDVCVSGKLAIAWGIDTGTTTPRSGGEPVPYNLKWLMVFERQSDGTWTCLYEIWNDNPLAQTKTESAEQELINVENEWADAWVKSDVAFFERIIAEEYMWTSPQGWIMTKAEDLALIKSGKDTIMSWVLAEMKVRVYGDAAVVTGRDTIKETYKGGDISSQNRWTHTWIKRAGYWQCVAGHSSEIAQK
jgi:ketosteroid isomerase-like protein